MPDVRCARCDEAFVASAWTRACPQCGATDAARCEECGDAIPLGTRTCRSHTSGAVAPAALLGAGRSGTAAGLPDPGPAAGSPAARRRRRVGRLEVGLVALALVSVAAWSRLADGGQVTVDLSVTPTSSATTAAIGAVVSAPPPAAGSAGGTSSRPVTSTPSRPATTSGSATTAAPAAGAPTSTASTPRPATTVAPAAAPASAAPATATPGGSAEPSSTAPPTTNTPRPTTLVDYSGCILGDPEPTYRRGETIVISVTARPGDTVKLNLHNDVVPNSVSSITVDRWGQGTYTLPTDQSSPTGSYSLFCWGTGKEYPEIKTWTVQ